MTGNTVVGVIQARMGSSRLPGKVLTPIVDDIPMLTLIRRRLAGVAIPWWLATTDRPADDVTAAAGAELGLQVFRGDELDVLSRFAAIAKQTAAAWVVRVTADDPFTDACIIQQLVDTANAAGDDIDLIGDLSPGRHFPLGYAPQIVRGGALLGLDAQPDLASHHRAHVTSRLIPDRADRVYAAAQPRRPDWRWTVDTPEDLEMARRVFQEVGADAQYAEIVDLLDRSPDIVALNAHISQKPVESG